MRKRTKKWLKRAGAFLILRSRDALAARKFRLRFYRLDCFDRAVAGLTTKRV